MRKYIVQAFKSLKGLEDAKITVRKLDNISVVDIIVGSKEPFRFWNKEVSEIIRLDSMHLTLSPKDKSKTLYEIKGDVFIVVFNKIDLQRSYCHFSMDEQFFDLEKIEKFFKGYLNVFNQKNASYFQELKEEKMGKLIVEILEHGFCIKDIIKYLIEKAFEEGFTKEEIINLIKIEEEKT